MRQGGVDRNAVGSSIQEEEGGVNGVRAEPAAPCAPLSSNGKPTRPAVA